MEIEGYIVSNLVFSGSIYSLYSASAEKGGKKVLLKASNRSIPQKSVYNLFQKMVLRRQKL